MADELVLSNASAGYTLAARTYVFNFASETSAHGVSAAVIPLFQAAGSGRISDFQIGVVLPAVSASGFVSGTVDATLRINSVACLSTNPSIAMAGSAGQAARIATNVSGALAVSGVVNVASGAVVPGDQVQMDYNARSVGSAAAGAAGKGFYATVTFRPKAV